jgi:hypothetical protein
VADGLAQQSLMSPGTRAEMRGGDYHFDAEFTPIEVFKRFFGTNNPFEALNGRISMQPPPHPTG